MADSKDVYRDVGHAAGSFTQERGSEERPECGTAVGRAARGIKREAEFPISL
jgi:hypothetical protein